jgi:hypothetical protein
MMAQRSSGVWNNFGRKSGAEAAAAFGNTTNLAALDTSGYF